ncbi:hypothetical protein ACAG26_24225 [Mycobacterium sp. pUA109]|uniref:hypothetical protein n=1 Tax=Mycobacterium sp. pUA109 TaxID=3238982 RepID=UPI00351B52E2
MADIVDRAKELLAATSAWPSAHLDVMAELVAEVERAREAEHDPGRCFHCTRCADADDSQQDALRDEIERLRLSRENALAEERRLRELCHAQFYLREDVQAERDAALAELDRLRPRRIETVEELDALPGETLVEHDGRVYRNRAFCGCWQEVSGHQYDRDAEDVLPALLVWTPEGD